MIDLILAGTTTVETHDITLDINWLGLLHMAAIVVTMISGLFFVLAGTLGVLRLPDFYTRIHAAGVTDTLGAELIVMSLIIQSGFTQMSLKLLLIGVFVLLTGPTATHAVAHAAHTAGPVSYTHLTLPTILLV